MSRRNRDASLRGGAGEPRVLGAVLAGGRSSRLGRDKAAETLGETSLLQRAVDTLRAGCERVVVVSSRTDTPEAGVPVVPDLRPDGGPLCGIEAALAHASDEGLDTVVVLACDLPFVGPDVVLHLVEALGDADACAPVRDGPPGIEPLCVVYRTGCLATVGRLLDEGRRAAAAPFDEVRGVRVDLGREPFHNVNTEADLRRARVGGRPPRNER